MTAPDSPPGRVQQTCLGGRNDAPMHGLHAEVEPWYVEPERTHVPPPQINCCPGNMTPALCIGPHWPMGLALMTMSRFLAIPSMKHATHSSRPDECTPQPRLRPYNLYIAPVSVHPLSCGVIPSLMAYREPIAICRRRRPRLHQ